MVNDLLFISTSNTLSKFFLIYVVLFPLIWGSFLFDRAVVGWSGLRTGAVLRLFPLGTARGVTRGTAGCNDLRSSLRLTH
jgi:hypothetical protein